MEPALTLHKLQVFREVVRCQSLTRAAEELYVSQPVVSAHVRDLEVYFGARLLHQHGRRMLPSEAGKAVYDYAVEVLQATEDARGIVRLLESAEAGSAVIGSTETPGAYLLPERLVRFKLDNPLAGITMDVASASEIWAQTFEGNLDFSIVAGPEPPSDLHSEVFSLEPLVLVCRSGHPLLGRLPISQEDLLNEPFVSLVRRRAYDERLQELGVSDQSIVMRLGNVEGLKQAVAQGVGLAIAFRCAVERELAAGTLATLRVRGVSQSRPFYLVYSRRKQFSPLQLRLLDFLRSATASTSPGRG